MKCVCVALAPGPLFAILPACLDKVNLNETSVPMTRSLALSNHSNKKAVGKDLSIGTFDPLKRPLSAVPMLLTRENVGLLNQVLCYQAFYDGVVMRSRPDSTYMLITRRCRAAVLEPELWQL